MRFMLIECLFCLLLELPAPTLLSLIGLELQFVGKETMAQLVAVIPQFLQRLPLLLPTQSSTRHVLAFPLLDGLLLVLVLEQVLEVPEICGAASVEVLLGFVGPEVCGFVEFGAGAGLEVGLRVVD